MNNNNGEPIDFSCLDPGRESADWDRRIGQITAAARELLAQRKVENCVSRQVVYWAGPILSTAAAVIMVTFGLFWYATRTAATALPIVAQSVQQQPAYTMVTWAVNNHIPNPAELFELDWRQQK